MRYLSLFSGIEAATVAWKPLGWECAAVSEILPYQSSIIAHHHPEIVNLGDVTKITAETVKSLGHIDVVVFGSPCQDMSLAGKRMGLHTIKDDTNPYATLKSTTTTGSAWLYSTLRYSSSAQTIGATLLANCTKRQRREGALSS